MIRLLPLPNVLPATVKIAVDEPPDPESWAVPRVVLPAVKVTVPPGEVFPEAAFTVAVNTVLAVVAMVAGLAATVVMLALDAGVAHPVTRL